MEKSQFFLLTSCLSSGIGSALILFTIPIISILEIKMTTFNVSLVATSLLLPQLLFSLSIGVLVDHYNKKNMLILIDVLRIVLIILFAIFLYFNLLNLYYMLFICLCLSTSNLFYDTLIQSVIPVIVRDKYFIKINSLVEGAISFSNILAPIIVGGSIWFFNINTVLYISILCFIVSIISINNIVYNTNSSIYTRKTNHLYQMLLGLKILFDNKVQRTISISAGIFNFFHSWFFTIFVIFILKVLLLSTVEYSVIVTLSATMGIVSVVSVEKIISLFGYFKTLFWSLFLIVPVGMFILITFITNNTIISCIILIFIMAVWDFLIIVNVVAENTLRHIMIDARILSRVFSASRFISYGSDPIGALSVGFFSLFLDIQTLLVVGVIGMGVSAIPILISKELRRIDYNLLQK